MRILILDDEDRRHTAYAKKYAGEDVIHVKSYTEFVAAYPVGGPWDIVHLDHDLGSFGEGHVPQHETYVDGWGCDVPYDGQDAAQLMCEGSNESLPLHVIVHSLNPGGAAKIISVLLSRGGMRVHRQPFDATRL